MTNVNALALESRINDCTSEEADQRLVRHTINYIENGFNKVVVRTVDTDVLVLLIGNMPYVNGIADATVYSLFGQSTLSYYNISEIATQYGDEFSTALPFMYGFSGCDTVSSFFGMGKCKWFDNWIESQKKDVLTSVFQQLGDTPTELTSQHLEILEKFVMNVYYPTKSSVKDLDVERMNHFSRLPNSDLRSIPPSRLGLLEHIKRTCFQAGWLWAECRDNVMLPKPDDWGWHKDEHGSYIPTWQVTHQPLMKIDDVTFTYTCQKSRCKNCKCTRTQVRCLPFCRCQMDCDNIYIQTNLLYIIPIFWLILTEVYILVKIIDLLYANSFLK